MAPKAPTRRRPNGVILFEGPSRIDGAPIVVIATGLSRKSRNAKTDAMIQTWILRSDVAPIAALQTGADKSICGGCVHRPKAYDGSKYYSRSCYVNVAQGPTTIYKAYRRGSYPRASISELGALFAGTLVRFGSYGDPAAVPVVYWQAIKAAALATTGYTHQWRAARLRDTLSVCQLSADTTDDVASARQLGVGSFRVKRVAEPSLPGEIVCPASAEAGKQASCATCRMCDGVSGLNVVINAHGIGAAQFAPRASRSLAVLTA